MLSSFLQNGDIKCFLGSDEGCNYILSSFLQNGDVKSFLSPNADVIHANELSTAVDLIDVKELFQNRKDSINIKQLLYLRDIIIDLTDPNKKNYTSFKNTLEKYQGNFAVLRNFNLVIAFKIRFSLNKTFIFPQADWKPDIGNDDVPAHLFNLVQFQTFL